MIKYRFSRVKCVCGNIVDTPRYKMGESHCDCGAIIWTEKNENNDEFPVVSVPDGYTHPNYQEGNFPYIVGWK